MANSTVEELRETLFIAEDDLPDGLFPSRTYTPIAIIPGYYSSDEIRLITNAENDGLLIGFNAWNPYWTVEIDGAPAQLFPANHAFWGVGIPKGSHEVVFKYRRR